MEKNLFISLFFLAMQELIVELKANVEDLTKLKKKLFGLGASYYGIFNQKDTYYKTNFGRFKIRETCGKEDAQIVYYERPDIPTVKTSRIILVEARPKESVIDLFEKIFQVQIIIAKIREIFMLQGTQIHLDRVTDLGFFIEFERPTINKNNEIQNSEEIIKKLMKKLNIPIENIESLSYSDLLAKKISN